MIKNSMKILYSCFLINAIAFSNENISLKLEFNLKSDIRITESVDHIIAIMVEFPVESEDDPLTSGNGRFLESQDINFINYDNLLRCDPNSHFLLDPPPHNKDYFESQIKAVQNYFSSISNGEINFDYSVIDTIYQLSNYMREYAYSENHLSNLFVESLEIASNDIDLYLSNNNLSLDNTLFVVFHAGLGQDISAGIFDPTIYDIHSAYLDEEMLNNLTDSDWWDNEICINNSCWVYENNVNRGLLLPETLNMIYYDVIEDLLPTTFVNESDLENIYCDSQYGITGLFSYLLGYAYGFPPMHNIENGLTRIGKFGLMDQGSFNGRGIIPSLPNPWTRINFLSSNLVDITDSLFISNYNLEIDKRTSEDNIYKISISEDEYFLLENSNNTFDFNNTITSINDIISDSLYHDYINKGYYLDVLDLAGIINVNQQTGVIEGISNYDYGMPGSGILLWHIIEPNITDYYIGMNNDVNNKAIHLEEGDGIVNLGYFNPYPGLLSQEVTTGYYDDYWYSNNQTYKNVNNTNSNIVFNNTSIPNSNTSSYTNSYISMNFNSDIDDIMNVSIQLEPIIDFDIISMDFNNFLGNNGHSCIYYLAKDDLIYQKCNSEISIMESSDFQGVPDLSGVTSDYRILHYNDLLYLVENEQFYLDVSNNEIKNINDLTYTAYGFFESLLLDIPQEVNVNYDDYSLGDIDQDGLDELIQINNGSISIINNNGTSVNGFPINDDFYGVPLVVDIVNQNEGNYPEIICKNGNKISLISYTGEILFNFPIYDSENELFVMFDSQNNTINLYNGNRVFYFNNINENGVYWSNSKSTTYNYPIVQGPSINDRRSLQQNIVDIQSDNGIDINRVYNYPNPFSNQTSFRFYVALANSISIKIYDVAGTMIEDLYIDNLIQNEYNEIQWDASGLNPGLYFAELKSDQNESKLIKLLIK